MELESRKSYFIRDLIVRILLIVLFIFLLMFLFPMPNLNPFYDAIFNDNVQTMKDAAEKWYTTDRMPEKEGEIKKLTLQQMLDKKLILPFVDKDGNSCDTNKSYVTVKKSGDEYIMKVSLTCGSQTDYIIEHIGCYNFCKDGKCEVEIPAPTQTATNVETGKVVVKKPTYTPTPSKVTYALEYEYERTHISEKWNLLDWQTTKMKETSDLVLVDTKTEYTGQKKVSNDSNIYKHIKDITVNHWSKDENWTDEVKDTSDQNKIRLYAVRTLYTGDKTETETVTKYRHIKVGNTDNWTEEDWRDTYVVPNNTTVLINTRYTLRKTTATDTTGYECGSWQKDSTWRTSKPNDTETVEWGDAYDTRTREVTTGTTTKTVWGDWQKDNTWRTSKPSNTSTKQWGDAWTSTTSSSTSNSYDKIVTTATPLTSDNTYTYKLFKKETVACTVACNGKATVTYYYYYRYPRVSTTSYKYYYRTTTTVTDNTTKKVTEYKYKYKNCKKKTNTSTSSDAKTVYTTAERDSLINKGYTLIKTEYKYKVNRPTYTADVIWTESITPPAGYKFDDATASVTRNVKSSLGKWVTNKAALGEYTEDITTRKQYKYYYNNPTTDTDEIYTESKVSPAGYTYKETYSIRDLCASKSYVENLVDEDVCNNMKDVYVDLGKWVSTESELQEYTYNKQERKLYRYKKRTVSTYTERAWFRSNPGKDWKATGNSRRVQN